VLKLVVEKQPVLLCLYCKNLL